MNAKQKVFVDWMNSTIDHATIEATDLADGVVSVKIEIGDVVAKAGLDPDGKVVGSVITGKNCAFAGARIYPNMFVAERLAMGLLQLPPKVIT